MRIASRRKARELALRVLYQTEIGGQVPVIALQEEIENHELAGPLKDFARSLVLGVIENRENLDKRLAWVIKGFDFTRLAAIDRNILRIALFELVHLPAVPPAVTIDEAIEIAKKYSTEESGKFVHGVLGRAIKDTPKANWDPNNAPPEFEEAAAEIEEEAEVLEVEEIDLDVETDEGKKIARIGGWSLRSREESTPDELN